MGFQVDVESLVDATRDNDARAKAKAKTKAKAKAMAVAEPSSDSDTSANALAGAPPAPTGEATDDAVDDFSTDIWTKVACGTKQLLVNCDNPLQDENVKLLRMCVCQI